MKLKKNLVNKKIKTCRCVLLDHGGLANQGMCCYAYDVGSNPTLSQLLITFLKFVLFKTDTRRKLDRQLQSTQ